MKKIYVGNLASLTNATQVQTLFEGYGKVLKAGLVCHHDTGEPLGFAYVLMSDDEEGNEAIQNLNGTTLDGRTMDVKEALPPGERTDSKKKHFHGMKLRPR
jgi:RNA recognition motif-containing protein